MPALPFLPGFVFNPNIGREDFIKAQRFTFENKVAVERDLKDPRFPKLNCHAQNIIKLSDQKPAWEAYHNRVLSFDACFDEPIYLVSEIETHRYRLCKIYYYLADDTMQIIEPVQNNCGITQGVLVKRHHFKKPGINNGYYTFHDLNVNITIEIYSRLYTTTDCDKFTRTFLTEAGIFVNEPIGPPEDPHKNEVIIGTGKGSRSGKKDTLGPYLKYHPQALRFYCIWDDCHNLFGTNRKMVLHYFLSDEAIEIIEIRPPNAGRNDTKVFWKRSPLPKEDARLPEAGEMTDTTVLTFSGLKGNENRYTMDTNPTQGRVIPYYSEEDFEMGMTLNVLGRNFYIYDCDEFTKNFYRLKYKRDLIPIKLPEETKVVEKREVYPIPAFGQLDDTLQNCLKLRPKPPKRDLVKFYQKDKYGYDPKALKFSAILTDDDRKRPRRFIITYFLSDDTLVVFEPFEENSGRYHGRFMMRQRAPRPENYPNRLLFLVSYGLEDLFVGNILTFSGKDFILTGADEYTYKHMEKNPDQFVHSDFKHVLEKMRSLIGSKCDSLKTYFQSLYPASMQFIPFGLFRSVMYEVLPKNVPEQEVITLARHYADEDDKTATFDNLVRAVHMELRRKNYNDFENLILALQAYDLTSTGKMTRDELYARLRSCCVPVTRDLLKLLLTRCPTSNDYCIDYTHLVDTLNYLKSPITLLPPSSSLIDINWTRTITAKSIERINYINFINDLQT